MKLKTSMQYSTEKSEVIVFQDFVTRSMEIQRHVREDYQGDTYLNDRLTDTIDLPAIKRFLQYHPASSVLNLVNIVRGNYLQGQERQRQCTRHGAR